MGRRKAAVTRLDSNSSDNSTPDKLDEILAKLSSLDAISQKLAKLETMFSAVQEENMKMKATIEKQQATIVDLKTSLNNLEQHGRSYSVRVNNFPLDGVDERDPPAIINKVFNSIFLPILNGAVSKQAITSVPTCFETIEMAHTLPGRGDKPKPIIVRFFNRNVKTLIFRHRKEFAPKADLPGSTSGSGSARVKYAYPFHDDLTRDTYAKMKALQADPRVHACWSTGGYLRYKLSESGDVRRVTSVYASNDDILK
jgi:hypothetical protein